MSAKKVCQVVLRLSVGAYLFLFLSEHDCLGEPYPSSL